MFFKIVYFFSGQTQIINYVIIKFLVPILKPLTENEYTVHDSFSFANGVRKLSSKNLMASLDVESLFTNIPLEETTGSIFGTFIFLKPRTG